MFAETAHTAQISLQVIRTILQAHLLLFSRTSTNTCYFWCSQSLTEKCTKRQLASSYVSVRPSAWNNATLS